MKLIIHVIFFILIFRSYSTPLSKFTLSRIKEAIKKFEESDNKQVFYQKVWPTPCTSDAGDIEVDAYFSYPILIWDVLSSFSSITVNGIICCFCNSNGVLCNLRPSGLWTDGQSRVLYSPRVVYDTCTPVLLVSAVYICRNNHQVPSHHPSVLAALPSHVYAPFYLTNRAGFTSDLLVQLCTLIDHGVSFLAIEDIIRDQYQHSYFRQKQRYIEDVRISRANSPKEFPDFCQTVFPFPHNRILRDVFVSYSSLFDQFFHNDMAGRTSEWLSCDHTFKSAANIGYLRESDGRWIKLFKCVFCVLGSDGKIMHWRFTRGESFDEVRSVFMELKTRLEGKNIDLKGIVIDNCCKWKSMLSVIYPGVPVKLDLFHAVQRFTKTLPAGARYGNSISKEYGLIFRKPSDLGEKRTQATPETHVILSNLASFLSKWSGVTWKGKELINEDSKKAISNLKVHIEKGCLSNIPAHFSTSGNERLHRSMNDILKTNKIGLELAYYRCSRLFYKVNNKCSMEPFHSYLETAGREGVQDLTKQNFGIMRELNDSSSSFAGPCLTNQRLACNSLHELVPQRLSSLRNIISDFIDARTSNDDIDHAYNYDNSASKNSFLEVAVDALNLFEIYQNLKNHGFTKFISKSLLPTSVGIGNLPTKKLQGLKNSELPVNDQKFHLEGHLRGFGLSLIPVPGDGNCFFSAIGFQLSNMLSSTNTNCDISLHLNRLGLNNNMTNKELASVLRSLIVEEWRSERCEDYMDFLPSNINFFEEVRNYENEHYFGGPLGDLMPIAMANLLHIPLAIITSEFHTPLISICPVRSIGNAMPMFLAFNSFGAGHYDAAVLSSDQSTSTNESEIQHNDCSHQQNKAFAKTKDTLSGSGKQMKKYVCRCGSTPMKNKFRNRYSSRNRCRCVFKHGGCSRLCKCAGRCGGIVCKKLVLVARDLPQKKNKSKRMPHALQKSKQDIHSPGKNITNNVLNFLELCMICAILHYLKRVGKPCEVQDVLLMYVQIMDALLDLGIVLPLHRHSQSVISREIGKLKKDFQE